MGFSFGTMGSAPAVVRNAINPVQSNQALKGQEYAQLKGTALQTIDETLDPENPQTQKLTAYPDSSNHLPSGASQALRTLAEESATADSGVSKNTDKSGMRYAPKKSADQATANSDSLNPSAPINLKEVTKSLRSKGIPSEKVNILAEAITARLTGQELTNTQRNLLSSALCSPTVQSVISKFIQKKSNGVDSTQNAVYDDSNIRNNLTNEASSTSWNLSNKSADTFSDHDYGTVIDGAACTNSKIHFQRKPLRVMQQYQDLHGDNRNLMLSQIFQRVRCSKIIYERERGSLWNKGKCASGLLQVWV